MDWDIHPKLERDTSLKGSEIVVTASYSVGEPAKKQGIQLKRSRLKRITDWIRARVS